MKKTNLYISAALVIAGMAACTSTTTTTGTSDSTSQSMMNHGDSTVTTTTTVTRRRYSGSFMPKPDIKYIDLRTRKQVTVRIDTDRGQIVNSETNEPIDLFVAPDTHDTIYGMTGSIVNNNIMHDEGGDYRVDTTKMASMPASTATTTDAGTDDAGTTSGNYKEKEKNGKIKIKTDDEKIKEKNGIIKEKTR